MGRKNMSCPFSSPSSLSFIHLLRAVHSGIGQPAVWLDCSRRCAGCCVGCVCSRWLFWWPSRAGVFRGCLCVRGIPLDITAATAGTG
ncbi:hypothetical protein V5799_006493 [Amblyomma americanum]|uniref:Uncharacterized protein n=1 Tax=Amblyomma americanum TaxID=6943 RepID=A0AAQ4DW84_AMBAM